MNLLLFQKKRLSKGIRLALDFMGGNLNSKISFSRGSNATVVGSNGLIQYAPHNLLTYSEQFDNAAWYKTRATVTANSIISPDGTTTADTVTATGADSSIRESVSGISAGATYTFSVYLKSDVPTSLLIYIVDSGGGSGNTSQTVNVTNQWQRFNVIRTTSALTTSVSCQIGGATSFSTGESVYAWGAQLNEGALQPYYSTTVKNLLGYSQNFENAAWTKINSSIAASAVIGPFGFAGGQKLVENTVNALHYVAQTQSTSANSVLTLSVYAKAGERTQVDVRVGGVGWAASPVCVVNLITGAIVSGSGATVVPVGDGWFRISLTAIADGTTQARGIVVAPAVAGNSTYTGDGTSGIYIFGAQLSDSASLDPYSYNPVAAPTSTAYYGPRFDYDPATLAPKGLLIEEQRTNLLIRSIPDLAIPTGWSVGIGGGTFTHTLVTAPSQFLGFQSFILQDQVTSGRGYLTTSITLSASTTYTLTCYFDTTNTYVTSGSTTIVFIGGLADATGTLSASVSSIDSTGKVSITFTTGTNIAATIRVGIGASGTAVGRASYSAWQLEAGAFPTSYIPTTSATVTRAADNASMVGSNFSSWYNQSEGTIYCASDSPLTTTTAQMNWYISDGNTSNVMFNRKSLSNLCGTAVVVGGVTQGDITSFSAITAYSTVKSAFAYKLNDLAISVNGASVGTDPAATIPTVDRIHLGQNVANGQILNGHIQSIKYYPTRLPNADLQRLTR